jgi:hypothetical protein
MACHRRIEQRLDTPLNAAAAIARSLAFMDTSGGATPKTKRKAATS